MCRGIVMKQLRNVSRLLLAVIVLIIASSLFVGCPDPVNNDLSEEPETVWISYSFSDCEYLSSGYVYEDSSYASDYFSSSSHKIKYGWNKKINKGDKITLLDNGQSVFLELMSGNKVEYKKECIFPKNLKTIIGWSKNKDGSTKDYDFGEEITVNEDLTLYPAYTKYGIGDNINGKTVVYVRRDYVTKEKEYSVIGKDWRYITVDVNAGKNSENRNWWYDGVKNVITSDNIGEGKANTKAIINPAINVGDNNASNNAFYYCSTVSSNGFVPSKGEMLFIANAIKYRKLKNIYRIEDGVKNFWTSSQKDSINACYVEMKKDPVFTAITYSLKDDASKAEKTFPIIPIIYYDDNEKVVK